PPAGPGTTTTTASTTPAEPVATQIQNGSGAVCALISDGTVSCWGNNYYGQLGDGTRTNSFVPVKVSGITTATQIVSGTEFGCALLADTTVSCWGYNRYGQLGNGTSAPDPAASVPGPVSGLSGVVEIETGGQNVCALLDDGTASCWGRNLSGSLGTGADATALPFSPVPVPVAGLTNVEQVDAGSFSSCALLADGSVNCWGDGAANGSLGHGAFANSLVPVQVSGISTATQISTNGTHGCALLGDGTAACWGRNIYGTLGDGTTTTSNVPVPFGSLSGIAEIRAGQVNTCARLSDGTAWCAGAGPDGQLGNGANLSSSVPVQVSGLTTVAQIHAGSQMSCALLADGAAMCWGQNSVNGRLGNNDTAHSNVPVQVLGLV
ncbi:MAG: RCC1 domain-containing protein, partial [Microthrixaceae bacterium]